MAHYIYGDRDRGEIFMGPHSPFTSVWASLSNWCVQTIKKHNDTRDLRSQTTGSEFRIKIENRQHSGKLRDPLYYELMYVALIL
jgi:hypothetical protein